MTEPFLPPPNEPPEDVLVISSDKADGTRTYRPKSFAEIQWVVPPKGVRAWNKAQRMYEQDHGICDPPDHAPVDLPGPLFTIPDFF